MRQLNTQTLLQAKQGLKKKQFSSLTLTKACLAQIKKVEPKTKAFLTVCEKEALKEARKADELLAVGESSLPLLGLPLALKDNFCTQGVKTTAGSKVLENFIPVYDATAVKRLKNAGAVILGKTNLDAWAHGSSTENSDFGPSRNPWDLACVPGGSSGGSAAAVAANECLAATGTDTGGSVRLPASFCGLVGLKPTYGRVSRWGIVAMASSLDVVGHLTQDVADAALLLNTTAGKDPLDATTLAKPVPDYLKNLKKGIKGLVLGLPQEYFTSGLTKEVRRLVLAASKKFTKLGARLEAVSLPHTNLATAVYYIIQPAEVSANLARYDGLRFGLGRKHFAAEAKRRIMLGTHALSTGYYEAFYLKAMQVRTLIKKDFENVFKKVDLVLTPVSPALPFKLGEKANDPLKMYLSDVYTITANLAGLPAIALPAGWVGRLPVGIQLLGPQWSEARLFQAAFAYEKTSPQQKKRRLS